MDYLHTVGVLHGDLKGANVLLKSTATDPRGFMCKLADFGLSRVLDLDMTHISTHTYGTISYMPPELLSQGKMTRACDVYSFGMLSESFRLCKMSGLLLCKAVNPVSLRQVLHACFACPLSRTDSSFRGLTQTVFASVGLSVACLVAPVG